MARHCVRGYFLADENSERGQVFGFTCLSNYICQIVIAVISRNMGRLAKVTLEKCAINGRERQCGCGRKDERPWIYVTLDCARLRRLGTLPNLRCPISRGNWVACGLLKRTIGGGGGRHCRYFFQFFLRLVNDRKESWGIPRLPDRVEQSTRISEKQ